MTIPRQLKILIYELERLVAKRHVYDHPFNNDGFDGFCSKCDVMENDGVLRQILEDALKDIRLSLSVLEEDSKYGWLIELITEIEEEDHDDYHDFLEVILADFHDETDHPYQDSPECQGVCEICFWVHPEQITNPIAKTTLRERIVYIASQLCEMHGIPTIVKYVQGDIANRQDENPDEDSMLFFSSEDKTKLIH